MPIYGTPPDGAQMDFVEPIPFVVGASGTVTANSAYLVRFRVGKALPVTGITVHVGGATSGNLDVGLYTSSNGGTTLTRVASSGSVAVGSTGAPQTVAFTAGATLQPGVDYWAAVALDNATATIIRLNPGTTGIGSNHALKNRVLSKVTSFPLPASLSSLSGGGLIPWTLVA